MNAKTEDIVKAFSSIGVQQPEIALLAHSVDFDLPEIPEDQVIMLRDAWTRCKRLEPRCEAFWAWVSSNETIDDLF